MSFLLAFMCAFCVDYVFGHSWAHCTSYHANIDGQDYDESQCSGYIRQWQTQWGATAFSTDRGVNYFGSNGAWCQSSFNSDIESMYDDGYPYAEYAVGDTIRIVWPAKNHANYECFNNIPDTSMKLYYNPTANQTSDGTTLGTDWVVLHDFQDGCTAGTDGCGFQNCPKFCENTDGAPCYGDFEIKAQDFSTAGFYTFMWYWIFNGGTSAYTTCFEAYVYLDGGNGGDFTPSPTSATPSPTTRSPTQRPTRQPTTDGGTYSPTPSPVDYTTTDDDTNNGVGDNYFVIVPICYDGASYDADKIIGGANKAYGSGVADWDIRYHVSSDDGDSWNATIQTFTDYGGTVTSGAYDYSTDTSLVCDSIEEQYNNIGECIICTPGEIRLYSTESYGTDDVDLPSDGTTEEPDSGGNSSGGNSMKATTMNFDIFVGLIVLYLFVQ